MSKSKSVNVSNYHVQYSDVTTQHWHPGSESFAGGDHLTTALENKWQIVKCALTKHWYAGMRSVRVYEFTITKDERTVVMPVLDNPYVERFIVDEGIELIEAEDAAV